MSKFLTGADALAALNAENGGGSSKSFAPLKSGSSYVVRVMSDSELLTYYGYSVFKVVNTFIAENPSTLNERGFPQNNLTLWDKAADYYMKQSFEESDDSKAEELRAKARQYRGKLRFIVPFIDLDTGLPIYVDLSKQQAQSVFNVIRKAASKLDKKAFELEKNGSGTSTTVTLTQLDLDDLNDKQAANFEKVGAKFDGFDYDGLLYEADEAEQAKFLKQADFDPALIGYGAPAAETAEDDEEYPF